MGSLGFSFGHHDYWDGLVGQKHNGRGPTREFLCFERQQKLPEHKGPGILTSFLKKCGEKKTIRAIEFVASERI